MIEKVAPSSNAPRIVLSLIVVAYLGLALLYARSVPKWNAPDEPGHFNYVKTIAQTGTLPILQQGDYDQDFLAKATAARFPDSMPVDGIRYESHQPPLYYLLATPLLWLGSRLDISTQVLILRLLSVIFGALTVLVTFGTARRLFPNDAIVPLAASAFVAFLPMHLFMDAAIDNDSLANLLLSTLLFCLVTSLQNRPASAASKLELAYTLDRQALLWGVLVGLGILTKDTASVGAILVVAVVLWQEFGTSGWELVSAVSGASIRRAIWRLVQAGGVALVVSGWWFVRNAAVYGNLDIFARARHDQVVVGQPLTGTFDVTAARHFLLVSFKSFWGIFGWMGTVMDERVYLVLALLTGCAILGLLLYLGHISLRPSELSPNQRASLVVLALAFGLVLAGVLQYNFTYVQPQGRYFFAAIAPIAIFFTLGLRELISARYAAICFALLSIGLFALDVVALNRFILPDLVR